jgi:hypothetical protein
VSREGAGQLPALLLDQGSLLDHQAATSSNGPLKHGSGRTIVPSCRSPSKGGESVQKDQSIQEMAEEVLMRQAKALVHRSGHSLEDARQAVSDTEAGRQLRDLANGEYRHEKAKEWQASVFWDRAEERLMHHSGSETLSRFVAERHYTWLESYMEWLEGKEERAQYHALLEEELASLRG